MARRRGPTLAVIAVLALAGCRSVGRFPTIDPSDYAYSYFNGVSTQVFQFSQAQVESSTLMALGDLGFTKIEREKQKDGVVKIKCWTLDHRPCCVWIKPRNETMAVLAVFAGLIGDELVSQTVVERVGMNFGTIPRHVVPLEATLERRFNPTPPLQPTLPKVVSLPATLPPDAVPVEPAAGDADAIPAIVPVPPAPAAEPGPFAPSEAAPVPTPPAPGPAPDTNPGS
jgi:hypothetical protein